MACYYYSTARNILLNLNRNLNCELFQLELWTAELWTATCASLTNFLRIHSNGTDPFQWHDLITPSHNVRYQVNFPCANTYPGPARGECLIDWAVLKTWKIVIKSILDRLILPFYSRYIFFTQFCIEPYVPREPQGTRVFRPNFHQKKETNYVYSPHWSSCLSRHLRTFLGQNGWIIDISSNPGMHIMIFPKSQHPEFRIRFSSWNEGHEHGLGVNIRKRSRIII